MPNFKKFLKILGPGFITGASDDDPTAIAAYIQSGARFGYHQLWTALFSFPFMSAIQEMCGRIGLVTGKGLTGIIKKHYPRPILLVAVFALLVSNVITIGADLGAMTSVTQLIVSVPRLPLLLAFIAITLFLEIFITYEVYAKYLKYLSLSLLVYFLAAISIKQNWGEIFRTIIFPTITINKDYFLGLLAIFGTNISPYLFFWQAGEEVEEEVMRGKIKLMGRGMPKITGGDLKLMKIDTIIGMLFSNFVVLMVGITAASTLGANGILNIETASQAAAALRSLAGPWAEILFAVGIISSGLLAIPILAGSASYVVSEFFGWREGLTLHFVRAKGFYTVIIIVTVVGLFINFSPVPPFKMLVYSAALNGILTPPLLLLIMKIANNKQILGKYINGKASNILGWIITVFMSLIALGFFVTLGN